MKDGAATALMGARGANGVILVNTKRGIYNSFDVDVNYRHGFDFPVNRPEMADAYTYAMAQNEALYYDGLPLQYTKRDLERFKMVRIRIIIRTSTGMKRVRGISAKTISLM